MEPWDKIPNPTEKGDLFYKHFETENEEFSFIIRRIEDLLGTDFYDKKGNPFSISYGDIAILVRRNNLAVKLGQRLERAGIQVIMDIGGEVSNRPEVVLGYTCVEYIFSKGRTQKEIRDLKDRLTLLYNDVFISRTDKGKPKYPKANTEVFLQEIDRVKEKADKVFEKATDKKDYLQEGLQPYYHDILRAFGADHFEFEEMYNYYFAVLSNAIADYESVWRRLRASEVKWFFGFMHGYGMYNYTETSHYDPSAIDAVKLMTIHKAKGLGFPVVFIPGAVEEQTRPYKDYFIDSSLYPILSYQGDSEDERRVFYAAITRSMKYLFITGSTHRIKVDGTPYKKDFHPHRFIPEITVGIPFTDNEKISRKNSGFKPRSSSRELFPTSYSDINCYGRCGYDYLLRNIYCYRAGVPVGFGYGTRIHNILNTIYQKFISDETVPSAEDIEHLFRDQFFLRYATDEITEQLRDAGMKVVNKYISLHEADFSRVLETEKGFEFILGDAIISGQIDLLKKVDSEGNILDVEIIDFKSEKEDEELYKRDYDLQLQMYAIACLNSLGMNPREASIHHLDANHLDAEDRGIKKVDISEPSLAAAREKINQVISGIISKDFQSCPSIKCKKCDWMKICPKKSGE
jgi:DNA helicase-2/ATP-dependent DNA helicase PcrA